MPVTTYVKPWSLLKTDVGHKLRPQNTTAATASNNRTPYQSFAPSKAIVCCGLAPRLLWAYNRFAACKGAVRCEVAEKTKLEYG